MSSRERVIAVIPKGRRNVIHVKVSERGGHHIIDIRQHEPNGLRMAVPTMKGIGNIDLAAARQLVEALEAALAQATQEWRQTPTQENGEA